MKVPALRGLWLDGPTLVAVLVLTVGLVPIVRWIADPPGEVSIAVQESDVSVANLALMARSLTDDGQVVDVVPVDAFTRDPQTWTSIVVDVRRSASASTSEGDRLVVDREASMVSIELVVERNVDIEVRGEQATIRSNSAAVAFPLADQPSLLSNAGVALVIAVSIIAAVFTISRPVSRRRDHEERLASLNDIYNR